MSNMEPFGEHEYRTKETDARIDVHFGTGNCINVSSVGTNDLESNIPYAHFCSPRQLIEAITEACALRGIDLDKNEVATDESI